MNIDKEKMEATKAKILVADDETDILEFVGYNLEKEGYTVFTAQDGAAAIASAKEHKPSLIILDIMMPGMDGIEVCRELRNMPQFQDTLIAFLTARGEDYSQIAGFDVGADEYITKPIRPRLLLARVQALLKRGVREEENKVLEFGNLSINMDKICVTVNDEEVHLAKKEFELVLLLTSKPGKVFTREEIYQKVWGADIIVGDRTLDVHIRKIREKIGDHYIKTAKGIGYKFDA